MSRILFAVLLIASTLRNPVRSAISFGNNTVRNGSAAFDTLQAPIPHMTVYYICIHILITFVTLLHLITPQ